MPNIWTHMIFADDIATKAGLNYTGYKQVFHLGAQGPDPFFYHNFWPWKKDKSVTKIGGKIHKSNCGTFLIEMLKMVKMKKNDPILRLYTLGFIAHHILDRNAHPYIIYKSGEAGNKHQILETTIDTILAQERGITTWRTPVYKEIEVGKNLPPQILEMMVELMKKVHQYEKDMDKLFNRSYQDMLRALKVLYDPIGIKNKLMGKRVSPFSHNNQYDKTVDYLNIRKKPWHHPGDKNDVSTESFYDIWLRAEKEGVAIFRAAVAYLDNQIDLYEVKKSIGNMSYETGRPCNEKMKMKYFKPIV